MKPDLELLNRYLDGTLDAGARRHVEAERSANPEFAAAIERLERLRRQVSSSRADSFAPYFSDRVMRRLLAAPAAVRADAFYGSLRMAFARVAIAGLLIAGGLAAINLVSYGDMDVVSSIPEALFGLPSASLGDALAYDAF